MRVIRAGTTLVELLVALALGALVLALCASALIGQRRAERRAVDSTRPGSVADEAVRVVANSLARLADSDTMWTRADTAMEWRAPVGAAVACAAAGDSVVVPEGGAGAWWEFTPDSGDVVELGDGTGAWTARDVVSVATRATGACSGRHHTLRFLDSIPDAGARIVRVTRRQRFMLYRGGDGLWWLGQRTCASRAPVSCGAAQPVAGPLSPPPAGLRFAIDSAGAGRVVTITARARGARRDALVSIRP